MLEAQSLCRIESAKSTTYNHNPRTASRLHEEIITGVNRR
jgi:biotin synthase-like enzyme